jgi:8-oxo-dGTP pyrophosphatase MutT (NUDIX family)
LDSLTETLLYLGVLPFARVPALKLAKQRGKRVHQKILFFLGNALRESWEEIRLSPFNVEYLGVLPVYHLQSRRWVIFPIVGRVKRAWQPKLSWEVEKIVSIPLESFYQPENYALYSLEVPQKLVAQGIPNPWEFPSFVHKEDGQEEILWGATFNIIQSFLRIIFDHPLPVPNGQRIIHKPLVVNYFSGNQEP